MDESNNKELVEKITSSKYFETLVDEQIRARMGALYQRNKWIVRALVLVIGIISAILGYNFYNFNAQYEEYQKKFDQLWDQGIKTGDMAKKLDLEITQIEAKRIIEESLKNERQEIELKKDKVDSEYRELQQEKFQPILNSADEVAKNIKKSYELMIAYGRSLEGFETMKKDFTNIYYKTILPALDTLEQTIRQIEIASSIRYLFAERSDRKSSGSEYRPATVKLPYSNDILKAVFHDVLTDENPKEVLLDFYLNNNKKPIEQSVFTETRGSYDQNIIKFISTEKNIYEIRSVFIYLPPNPPLYRIPDFVVLKISLLEKNEKK